MSSEDFVAASGDQVARPQPGQGVSHTPGPWLAGKPSSVVGWPVVAPQAQGRMVANITFATHSVHDPVHPEHVGITRAFNRESEANACLIAAAPDLLDALRAAYAFISAPQRMDTPKDGPKTATYRIENYNALTAKLRAAIAKASGQ